MVVSGKDQTDHGMRLLSLGILAEAVYFKKETMSRQVKVGTIFAESNLKTRIHAHEREQLCALMRGFRYG